ncbi:MAG: N-acetylglucosamine-6-phosphate deacetylase [Spirulinaceae cyanobacterium]
MIPNSFTIINARLSGYQNLQQIQVEEGVITAIVPAKEGQKPENTLDFQGDWLSLGGIDLQINGCLGLAFPDLEKKHLPLLAKISKYLWNQGVDGYLPTIVTTSPEKIKRSLATISAYISSQPSQTAQILGVHLEGPFLNPEKRGAHPQEYLLPLTLDKVKSILGDYKQIVKIITLAPELDSTGQIIPYLNSLKITISLGHSLATASQAKEAFNQGASMVTHAFNAMPSLHHRQPGLLGEALVNPQVKCGFIADGQHICPTMMKLLLKAGNYHQGIFLVSDALAPIGLPDGIYPWDSRQIEVKQGTARLADGTLSGTTLSLLKGVKNLVEWEICDLGVGIALATESPRQAMGQKGLGIGTSAAQLLRWHWQKDSASLTWKRLTNPAL